MLPRPTPLQEPNVSYDYMLFRATDDIDKPEDFGPETVARLKPEAVIDQLDDHLAGIDWSRRQEDTSEMPPDPEFQPPEAVWTGAYRAGERWLDFKIIVKAGESDCLHVSTSHKIDDREQVEQLCRALGMTGLDGQKMEIIRP